MRYRAHRYSVAAFVLVATTVGCRKEHAAQSPRESTQVVVQPSRQVVEAAGALATRSEPQEYFDRAREALVANDLISASQQVREAAGFFREHTERGMADAQIELEQSAAELRQLARELASGKATSVKQLDYAFARAQKAESDNHYFRAIDALKKNDTSRAADELTMAIDHFERAAKDGGVTISGVAMSVLSATRSAALSLSAGTAIAPEAVDRATAAFARHGRALGTTLKRRKA